jgi:hypothetical protein
LYGAFVWARRALNRPKHRFPARAVPIVYTWANGSEPGHRAARAAAGGAGDQAPGTSRDRDNGELRFALRSLERFLPWWRGHLFLVTPPGDAQCPGWLAEPSANPRLHLVDQESLFPEAQAGPGYLPTFNTNAVEATLHRLQLAADGGPRPPKVFVHMNDDYIWTAPAPPQLLFGPNCSGLRQVITRTSHCA